jgi:hypothetical protein
MSKQVILAIVGLATFFAQAAADPPQLPGFGPLCDPGPEWQAVRDERSAGTRPLIHGDFFVFARKSTAERFIIAIHPPAPADNRNLIYYSDSAFEMPTEGFPPDHSSATTTALRNRVVELRVKSSQPVKALEYTFVSESPQVRNWMANGYVMRLNDRTVFVQHSSDSPITDAFAREMAIQLAEKN